MSTSQVLLVAVALATFGSLANGGETRAANAAEKAGARVGEAADATAAETKKVGHQIKRETKKSLKATGAALDRAGNKIEEPN